MEAAGVAVRGGLEEKERGWVRCMRNADCSGNASNSIGARSSFFRTTRGYDVTRSGFDPSRSFGTPTHGNIELAQSKLC